MRAICRIAWGLVFVAIIAVQGCSGGEYSDKAVEPGLSKQLILYCGAGIMPAAKALIEVFEKENNIKINATYAGSGRLLGQIVSLQTGDLFMPGAALYVDKAIAKNLAHKETRETVAYFVPVIFVQKGNPKEIHSLADLLKKGVRVGLGDERSCAVGKKTLKILEKNKIPYEDLAGNVVYKSGTVNELALAVQLKNVDAVICWDTNARHFLEHGDMVDIPYDKNIPSTIPIVLLECSKHKEAAKAFIDFITSDRGKRILTEQEYTVLLPEG